MVVATGIEPVTSPMSTECSTAKLRDQVLGTREFKEINANDQIKNLKSGKTLVKINKKFETPE